jgi:hypothetical protein
MILIFEWILLLEIQTNYKNCVCGRKTQLSPQCVHTWANGTGYTSSYDVTSGHVLVLLLV